MTLKWTLIWSSLPSPIIHWKQRWYILFIAAIEEGSLPVLVLVGLNLFVFKSYQFITNHFPIFFIFHKYLTYHLSINDSCLNNILPIYFQLFTHTLTIPYLFWPPCLFTKPFQSWYSSLLSLCWLLVGGVGYLILLFLYDFTYNLKLFSF